MSKLRVLVVGSIRGTQDPKQKAELRKAAEELGATLAERGHTVLIGSDDPDDIDPDVVRGALSASQATPIEVHLMQGAKECYKSVASNRITNHPHRYRDWDVTVLEVLRHNADAIIALGGRIGVVQTGIAGWMLGRAVLPIAAFEGGGVTVWGYGSGERRDFYFGALSDQEIDSLQASWNSGKAKGSADFAVTALERIAEKARRAKTPRGVFIQISFLVLLTLLVWVALLVAPLVINFKQLLRINAPDDPLVGGILFILSLVSVCAAGALGSLMQTLRGIRDDKPATTQRIVVDLVLGVSAGFLTSALYLIAQIAITGRLEVPATPLDYTRVALITGLAALFASLYLDAALARFDSLKESVMAGEYGQPVKNKP